MRVVLALCVSILGAFCTNRWILRRARNGGLALLVLGPLVEEFLKLASALGFGVFIPFVHVAFGAAEACFDVWNAPRGVRAGALSLACHSGFGVVSLISFRLTGSVMIAFGVPLALHVAWNWFVLTSSLKRGY